MTCFPANFPRGNPPRAAAPRRKRGVSITVLRAAQHGLLPMFLTAAAAPSQEAIGVDIDLQASARGDLDPGEPFAEHRLEVDGPLRLDQEAPAMAAAEHGERRRSRA